MSLTKKILNQPIKLDPWPHQIVANIINPDLFKSIKYQCRPLLDIPLTSALQIYPKEFSNYGLSFTQDLNNISKELQDNFKTIIKQYPYYRYGLNHSVDAHLSITPPLPYTHEIHSESLEKVLSIVVYISPDQNIGTRLYTKCSEASYVGTVPWQPNLALIFCGQTDVTWHSYQSDSVSNRITLNFFIKSSVKLPNK